MPRTCEECEEAQANTEDPNACAHPEGCPWSRVLDDPELVSLYSFAMTAIDQWTEKDEFSKRDVKKFGVSLEKFDLACRLDRVDPEDQREALQVCGLVATWSQEAQDWAILAGRRKARER